MLDLPVGNLQDQKLGKVYSMGLDIPRGRILNVIVLAPGNFKTKSVVPAMALSFNAARDGLVLDDTKTEFADEPRYVIIDRGFGVEPEAKEETYKGPHTSAPLEQGTSARDMDRTALIKKNLSDANISGLHVEVGTINGRVTLRGWAKTSDDKRRAGEIASAASRMELVDNQLTVGEPVANE